MADGNHLYLVDGSSYIFRAYHRLPPLTNRHGQPAGAVYGYTTMLWKLADGLNKADGPTHMAVILDASEHTFRNEMYDQYKAHRPPPPEDLVPQFPLIRTATRAFSIPCIEEAGLEADDIIACYVTAAKDAGWKVTIVSSDKDLMQLVEDGTVDMLDTMNDRRIDSAYVREKFGVGPGDARRRAGADGRQGRQCSRSAGDRAQDRLATDCRFRFARGGARQCRDDHQAQAQAVADRACRCRAAVAQAGRAGLRFRAAAAARGTGAEGIPARSRSRSSSRSKGSSRFSTGSPAAAVRLRGGAAAAAASTSPRHPSRSAPRERLPSRKKSTSTAQNTRQSPTRNRSIAGSPRRRPAGRVAVDTETDCIDCIIAKLAGISLATEPNRACYIPVGHSGADLYSDAPDQLPMALVLEKLKPLMEDPAVLKIGHNFKYDWVMFDKAGIDVAPVDDTMVMSFDLDAGPPRPRARRAGQAPLRPRVHPVQAGVRHGQEPDHVRQGAAQASDRICGRGRRHHASPVAPAEAAAGGGECRARLRAGRPPAGAGGRRGWSGAGSRSTAIISPD